jgi:DNA-directed RNA polymerase subunit M/transcription elongation factor TFIIS
MTSKGKKEVSDNEDIRQKTLSLIEKCTLKKLSKDITSKIENGIENNSKNENEDFNVMLYTIYTIKVLENLKNDYVITNIKNGTWKPEDLAILDKDVLNPEKWQKLQDIRLPKNVKKEKRKGVNKCKKCGSWYTCFFQKQTRSADEPMTVFCSCEDCNFKWKF